MAKSNDLTDYEKIQMTAIKAWKNEDPGVVNRIVGLTTYPATWLINKMIPKAAIQGVLDTANSFACEMADVNEILGYGEVGKICELRNKNLELSDGIADRVHKWAIGIAAAEGGATGYVGIFGLAVDIPAIITIALRTIHRIGLCYGYECQSDMDKKFALGILSASSANSMSEKIGTLTTLRSIQVTIAKQTSKAMAEKVTIQQLSKEGGVIASKNVAEQVGTKITRAKTLEIIPFIGAGVGASVNAWFVKDVGWAARRTFQERWLINNRKITKS